MNLHARGGPSTLQIRQATFQSSDKGATVAEEPDPLSSQPELPRQVARVDEYKRKEDERKRNYARKKRKQVKDELESLHSQLAEAQLRIAHLEERLSHQLTQPPTASPEPEQYQQTWSTTRAPAIDQPATPAQSEVSGPFDQLLDALDAEPSVAPHDAAPKDPSARPLLDLTADAIAFSGAESLEWPHSNVRAVLPYLPGAVTSAGVHGGNVLDKFAALLKTTTQFPDSRDAHGMVVHLGWVEDDADQLADLVKEHMQAGKVVVLDGCTPVGSPVADFPSDMRLLVNGEHGPYDSMSMDEFCSSINGLGRIRCAMDLKPGRRLFDPLVEKLAEGHEELRSPSHSQKVQDYNWIPLAALHAEDWCLAHQGGFLTASHADAFGLCTSIEVVGEGAKLWFILSFEDPAGAALTREELLRRGSLVLAHGDPRDKDGASNSELRVGDGSFKIVGSCIVLRAGQKILQPPGQAHLVFTPVHCTTLGKQFLCYATLHLTEYARAVEFKTRGRGTNQDLQVLQHMLLQMAAALPARVAAGQEFRRKPLIALCLMVLKPRDYIPAQAYRTVSTEAAAFLQRMVKPKHLGWVRGAVDMLAAETLTRVLLVLAGGNEDIGADYLTESMPWRDPGPIVDATLLRGLLADLVNAEGDELQSMFDVRTRVDSSTTAPQGGKRKRV
ncbi:hypothetical protein HDZ31DRAFT_64903 [Schizophyllum fasciatum]